MASASELHSLFERFDFIEKSAYSTFLKDALYRLLEAEIPADMLCPSPEHKTARAALIRMIGEKTRGETVGTSNGRGEGDSGSSGSGEAPRVARKKVREHT